MKKVNIYTTTPLVIFTPPAYGTLLGEVLTEGDILYCIHAGARVEEILENERVVPLGLNNYNLDNSAEEGIESTIKVKEEVKVEEAEADKMVPDTDKKEEVTTPGEPPAADPDKVPENDAQDGAGKEENGNPPAADSDKEDADAEKVDADAEKTEETAQEGTVVPEKKAEAPVNKNQKKNNR